ncbi:MAG: DUF4093 domain-containing protein [Oscillospiraceae bacterium]|nr:DUF4093 domain-containing protein [Oscillospiraceae bacterium]
MSRTEQQKIVLRQAVLVEGKYDKAKLASLLDALIIDLDGFHIFHNRARLQLIRRLASERGVVIFTDSDRAGFQIRAYLKGALPSEQVWHAYLPDIFGKERRKVVPSAEGKIGVEGASRQVIIEALARAGVHQIPSADTAERITKLDLFEAGLSGKSDSRARRMHLLRSLDLPANLPTNTLPGVLSALMSRAQFFEAALKSD